MELLNWNKVKHLDLPFSNLKWSNTHMQTPVPYIYKNKLIVFYGTRDENNDSSISWVELDANNNFKVVKSPKKPLLTKGDLGCFDDSGVMPSSIVKIKNKYFLYYMGWSQAKNVPSQNAGGLAEIDFETMQAHKVFKGPILDRTRNEPQYCTCPRVYKIKNKYFMYYLGVNQWIDSLDKKDATYEIRIGTSTNGIDWVRDNTKALSLKNKQGGHYPFSVLKFENKFYGFYSSRNRLNFRENPSDAYKINLAESPNGLDWKMVKNINIQRTDDTYDNIMQAYPSVIKFQDSILLFYNGNNFGKNGIEIAINKNH